jgi:hypothetical protein
LVPQPPQKPDGMAAGEAGPDSAITTPRWGGAGFGLLDTVVIVVSEGGTKLDVPWLFGFWELRAQKYAPAAKAQTATIAPTMMPASAPADRPRPPHSSLSLPCLHPAEVETSCMVGEAKTVASGSCSFPSSLLMLVWWMIHDKRQWFPRALSEKSWLRRHIMHGHQSSEY